MREINKNTVFSKYPWYTKRLEEEMAMQNNQCVFQSTAKPAGHYVIHPDWCSEKIRTPQFEGRRYRPWSYEFQGARSYTSPGTRSHSNPVDRRAQSAPMYSSYRGSISVNDPPGVHHSLTQPPARVGPSGDASRETRDYKLERPRTMMYIYEDGACANVKYKSTQPPGGAGVTHSPDSYGMYFPPGGQGGSYTQKNYRITHAPDGSIRRIGMTPAATSLFMNAPESSHQRIYTPNTFQMIPQGLQMSDDSDVEEGQYFRNSDMIELEDHLEYLPDGKHYQNSYGNCSNNKDAGTERAPVDYWYPAATYRPGKAPQPAWVGDTHLDKARYTGATLRNPYMNFVNATWMV